MQRRGDDAPVTARIDEFVAGATPLALDGNEFAAESLVRVITSDDPDAALDTIVEECSALISRVYQALIDAGWQPPSFPQETP